MACDNNHADRRVISEFELRVVVISVAMGDRGLNRTYSPFYYVFHYEHISPGPDCKIDGEHVINLGRPI